MQQFKAKLSPGYNVVIGGTVEDSAKAQASVFAVFPLMLLVADHHPYGAAAELSASVSCAGDRATGTHQRVAAALLISGAPMGFVAILGIVRWSAW
jgi:hypothetical protein